jgi:hypothetical protein
MVSLLLVMERLCAPHSFFVVITFTNSQRFANDAREICQGHTPRRMIRFGSPFLH